MGPAHVENIVDLAVRMALAYRTVSHITFPVDFQEMEVKNRQRSKRNIPHHTSHAEADGAMLADPRDLDRAAAHACGGAGFTVEDPADCGRVVEEFLKAPGPALLQAEVDPHEPPLPAKVTAEQALRFAESLVRGEPNRSKIALTAISDKVREMVSRGVGVEFS